MDSWWIAILSYSYKRKADDVTSKVALSTYRLIPGVDFLSESWIFKYCNVQMYLVLLYLLMNHKCQCNTTPTLSMAWIISFMNGKTLDETVTRKPS